MLVCGSDLLESFSIPGAWIPEQVRTICRDFGVVCIHRERQDIEKVISNDDILNEYKGGRPCVADFVHGSDGLGKISLPPPKSKKIEKTASEFLVDMVSKYPGEVSILALGPLTNFALVKRVVILGGSFFALGNVNHAAEANLGCSKKGSF
ncbi:Uridine nucleosidase 1 [Camellia lanceoleosa]|uniref:Uridine nucleosidase 1 n=1 Tax=Camellia lanceoleosa TaxID=1840588 RepID=A0ACC0IH50_9ERIC|nr:Uridine nucleosidase 1 [Camellia lanceoleosa]